MKLILILPFIGAVSSGIFGFLFNRSLSKLFSTGSIFISACCSLNIINSILKTGENHYLNLGN
jgi:NADH:ubiquinone oxidoreductase subunit 5 (subunit L)/multisubunit Na+/H+ antiporter MnhA subunit